MDLPPSDDAAEWFRGRLPGAWFTDISVTVDREEITVVGTLADEASSSAEAEGRIGRFRADTRDEIGIATNAGGRSTFANVGRTRREGAELAARWQIAPAWRANVAASWLDAVYRDTFFTCAGIPCTAPTVPVPAGNRIAGTVKKSGFAELAWRVAPDTELGAELRAQGGMAVNDLNSDATEGVWIGALRASHKIAIGRGQLDLLVRIDNLSDRRYAGSVIVGDANGRFFEPAPGRQWLLGATWRAGW
jgi:iron complex outermembrane receptor protein